MGRAGSRPFTCPLRKACRQVRVQVDGVGWPHSIAHWKQGRFHHRCVLRDWWTPQGRRFQHAVLHWRYGRRWRQVWWRQNQHSRSKRRFRWSRWSGSPLRQDRRCPDIKRPVGLYDEISSRRFDQKLRHCWQFGCRSGCRSCRLCSGTRSFRSELPEDVAGRRLRGQACDA